MTSSAPDYANEQIVQRNRLPARAHFDLDNCQSLNGRWKFNYAPHADLPLPSLTNEALWSPITVPGHWQLQGYGKPHYTNVQYPFPADPPHVPSENPTGVYYTTFTTFHDRDSNAYDYRLRFGGVDSAFHLFVNGKEVGYSQGSRNPAEFDISNVIHEDSRKENDLVVKVYQWSDGSYIEDQDQWWLSGIFRDVHLTALPRAGHIEDFTATTKLDEKYQGAELHVEVKVAQRAPVELRMELFDAKGRAVGSTAVLDLDHGPSVKGDEGEGKAEFSQDVVDPLKWTAETPHLYKLRLKLSTIEGKELQVIDQQVGFRQVEIKDGVLTLNGRPILLKGVNRHDHHPRLGRAVPQDFMRHDLMLMKKHNINAVRCSHYPNDPFLYQLANEIGLYVMDEADLECHGFYDAIARPLDIPESMNYEERKKICFAKAAEFTSNNPTWKEAYVDRMRQVVHRDKNQPSVIIWSLGNEAFYGQNHKVMYDWAKEVDPTRPIHYEGDAEAKSADMFSYMYPSVSRITKLAKNDGKPFDKPIVLCEYGHAMGAGPGALKEYQDAFYEWPRLCGGFIWEWANHGLLHTDEKGNQFYAYGGDFGDEPNDDAFVMDGICDSEHQPGPGLIELKQVLQPVKVRFDAKEIQITNLYDFTALDHLQATWEIVPMDSFSTPVSSGELDLSNTGPGETNKIPMVDYKGFVKQEFEYWLNISFKTRASTAWATAGSEVAWAQYPIVPVDKYDISVDRSQLRIGSSGDLGPSISLSRRWNETLTVDSRLGMISKWQHRGLDIFSPGGGPRLTFWRAITDNDRPWDAKIWQRYGLDQMTTQVRSFKEAQSNEGQQHLIVDSYLTPPCLAWGFDVQTTYKSEGPGTMVIHVKGSPRGHMPPTLPRIGLEMKLPRSQVSEVLWYGRGPHQSYADMHGSARVGQHNQSLDGMNTRYDVPQENGNRSGTSWAQVLDESGNGVEVVYLCDKNGQQTFDFAVHKYTSQQLDEARHPCDLKDNDFVVLRVDAKHRGLGTGSCGPGVLKGYELECKPFEFEVQLNAIRR